MNEPDPTISLSIPKLLRFNKLLEELQTSCSFRWKEYLVPLLLALCYGFIANIEGYKFLLIYSGLLVVSGGFQQVADRRNRKQVELLIELLRELEDKQKQSATAAG
jgi:hypothetical protein